MTPERDAGRGVEEGSISPHRCSDGEADEHLYMHVSTLVASLKRSQTYHHCLIADLSETSVASAGCIISRLKLSEFPGCRLKVVDAAKEAAGVKASVC